MSQPPAPPPADLSVINKPDVSTGYRENSVIMTKAFVSAKASVLLRPIRAQSPGSLQMNHCFNASGSEGALIYLSHSGNI